MATASQRLAQEASGGAAAIEETSAAAKEVVSLARKSAEQAKTAATLMDTVDAKVGEGTGLSPYQRAVGFRGKSYRCSFRLRMA